MRRETHYDGKQGYVCTYVCMYVCVYVHVHVHVCMHVCQWDLSIAITLGRESVHCTEMFSIVKSIGQGLPVKFLMQKLALKFD